MLIDLWLIGVIFFKKRNEQRNDLIDFFFFFISWFSPVSSLHSVSSDDKIIIVESTSSGACSSIVNRCHRLRIGRRRHHFLSNFANFQLQANFGRKYFRMFGLSQRRNINFYFKRFKLRIHFNRSLTWKVEVAWLVGNKPCSWNNCMTNDLRWSRVLRRFEDILGDSAGSNSMLEALYTNSGLKSGPKNFWELIGVEDMGVLASEPKPSVDEDTFLFLFLKTKAKIIKKSSNW